MWDARIIHYSALDSLQSPLFPSTRHGILLAAHIARCRERQMREVEAARADARLSAKETVVAFLARVRRLVGRPGVPAAGKR